ncbi:MAG: hypothetical protein EXQ93_06240 [Alphaproteobacteria bacterium]|nr:hypothetical protein [Alphaproteobacteria bacterium]
MSATAITESESLGEVKVVEGRSCGTCTLCCKLLRIPELNKPQGWWCTHCAPRSGCRAYETRPQSCREFFCGFMTSPSVSEEWRPSVARIVLMAVEGGISAVVDRDRPQAWKAAPYYDQLKGWARQGMEEGWFVLVRVDRHITAILPERDVELGIMEAGEGIEVGWYPTPAGMAYEARKIPARGE